MVSTAQIRLNRDCEAIEIPSGRRDRLAAGTPVRIAQSLGASYTVATDQGAMYRLDQADADALGMTPARIDENPASGYAEFREEAMWDELRTVFDPEIPVNIVDLGLIYAAHASPVEGGKRVEVQMSLTAPGCGMSEVLKSEVENKIRRLPGVSEVQVEVVFDPPWNPGRMSDAAKLQLGFDLDYGAPAPSSPDFRIIR